MGSLSPEVTQISTGSVSNDDNGKGDAHKNVRTAAEIEAWIVSHLAELLKINPDEIDITIPFDRYGLDSAGAVGMSGDLEEWLGSEFEPTLLYDYPTIEALAQHLAEDFQVQQ